jgi:hypothetical protein
METGQNVYHVPVDAVIQRIRKPSKEGSPLPDWDFGKSLRELSDELDYLLK